MNVTSTLLPAALLAMQATAANAASFSRQVPVKPGDRVSISNIAGSVTITTWDRREVDVQGELGDGVDHVEVNQDKGGVEFRVVIKRGAWRSGDAHLQIRVPTNVWLEATTVSASLEAPAMPGRVRLKSISGSVRAGTAGDDLEATSVSGRVEIAGGNAHSRIRASTASGGLVINQGAGEVEARSTSGGLDVTLNGADHVHLSTVSGSISVRGGLAERGSLEASSMNGRVKVAAQATGFRYEASSFSGRVSTCFDGEAQRNRRGGGSLIEGVRGAGGAIVVARSHSGGVEICDR